MACNVGPRQDVMTAFAIALWLLDVPVIAGTSVVSTWCLKGGIYVSLVFHYDAIYACSMKQVNMILVLVKPVLAWVCRGRSSRPELPMPCG